MGNNQVKMDLMQDISLLQTFWLAKGAIELVSTVSHVARGTYHDKCNEVGPDGKLGIFQFKKRMILFHALSLGSLGWVAWNAIGALCFGREPGYYFTELLEKVTSPATTTVAPAGAILGIGLYSLHSLLRYYISSRISIYSGKRTLNIVWVPLFYVSSIATAFSLIADGPSLTSGVVDLSLSDLKWHHPVAVILFILADLHHYQILSQLARLRRNKAGHIVTTAYKMPKGHHAFDAAASPQLFTEMIAFAAVCFATGFQNKTWLCASFHLFADHLYQAYNNRRMYQTKYEDFPKNRAMLIPKLL